jgi:hypothetical protein
MFDLRSLGPHAFEESHERGVSTGKLIQDATAHIAHRQRARHTARGKMLHKTEKKRQIVRIDALLVDRQNEGALSRMHKVIGIFDALCDSLAR